MACSLWPPCVPSLAVIGVQVSLLHPLPSCTNRPFALIWAVGLGVCLGVQIGVGFEPTRGGLRWTELFLEARHYPCL